MKGGGGVDKVLNINPHQGYIVLKTIASKEKSCNLKSKIAADQNLK